MKLKTKICRETLLNEALRNEVSIMANAVLLVADNYNIEDRLNFLHQVRCALIWSRYQDGRKLISPLMLQTIVGSDMVYPFPTKNDANVLKLKGRKR